MNIKPYRLIFESIGSPEGKEPKTQSMEELGLVENPETELAQLRNEVELGRKDIGPSTPQEMADRMGVDITGKQSGAKGEKSNELLTPQKRRELTEAQNLVDQKDRLIADLKHVEDSMPNDIRRIVRLGTMQNSINHAFYASENPAERKAVLDVVSRAVEIARAVDPIKDLKELPDKLDKIKQRIITEVTPMLDRYAINTKRREQLVSNLIAATVFISMFSAGAILVGAGTGIVVGSPPMYVVGGILAAAAAGTGIYANHVSYQTDPIAPDREAVELDNGTIRIFGKETPLFLYDVINNVMPSLTPEQLNQLVILQKQSAVTSPTNGLQAFNEKMISEIKKAGEDGKITEREFEKMLQELARYFS